MDKVKITDKHIVSFNRIFGNILFQSTTEYPSGYYDKVKAGADEIIMRDACLSVIKQNPNMFKTKVSYPKGINPDDPVRIEFRVIVLNPDDFQEKLINLFEIWKKL